MKIEIPFGICQFCGKMSVLENKRVAVAKGAYKKYKTYKVCPRCKKKNK